MHSSTAVLSRPAAAGCGGASTAVGRQPLAGTIPVQAGKDTRPSDLPPHLLPPGSDLHAVAYGDILAWMALNAQYRGLVAAIARSYGVVGTDVDDVVQRTWLRLLQHAKDIRDPNCVSAWISTTARRESIRLRRGQVRLHLVADVVEDHADVVPSALDGLLLQERATALRMAVATLPRRQRRLVEELLDNPGLSYEELSERLDMPVGSIGPTRLRALRRLRESLGQQSLFAECA